MFFFNTEFPVFDFSGFTSTDDLLFFFFPFFFIWRLSAQDPSFSFLDAASPHHLLTWLCLCVRTCVCACVYWLLHVHLHDDVREAVCVRVSRRVSRRQTLGSPVAAHKRLALRIICVRLRFFMHAGPVVVARWRPPPAAHSLTGGGGCTLPGLSGRFGGFSSLERQRGLELRTHAVVSCSEPHPSFPV